MSYITHGTVWPESEVSAATKVLIRHFFELADLNSPEEAGSLMASEVFSSNGIMKVGKKKTSGTEGSSVSTPHTARMRRPFLLTYISGLLAISGSRKNAWDAIQKRNHHISRVYAQDQAGKDLLLIGDLTAETKRGVTVVTEFCARCLVDEKSSAESPRLALYEVWTVLLSHVLSSSNPPPNFALRGSPKQTC